jgi:hypothetical protein
VTCGESRTVRLLATPLPVLRRWVRRFESCRGRQQTPTLKIDPRRPRGLSRGQLPGLIGQSEPSRTPCSSVERKSPSTRSPAQRCASPGSIVEFPVCMQHPWRTEQRLAERFFHAQGGKAHRALRVRGGRTPAIGDGLGERDRACGQSDLSVRLPSPGLGAQTSKVRE